MKASDEKKLKIKDSLQKTREKRSHQICKVYSVKIDESKLNIPQKLWLNKIFLEAKWFYNSCGKKNQLSSAVDMNCHPTKLKICRNLIVFTSFQHI